MKFTPRYPKPILSDPNTSDARTADRELVRSAAAFRLTQRTADDLLNATRRLFDRFEKSGPSWLPIIILSAIGLIATIVCVRQVAHVTVAEFPAKMQEVYVGFREIGLQSTLLYEVSESDKESLDEEQSEFLEEWRKTWTELEFAALVQAKPAFPVDESLYFNAADIESDSWTTIYTIWQTQETHTIIAAALVSDPDRGTKFGPLVAISRRESELIATETLPPVAERADFLAALGKHRTFVQAFPTTPGVLAELIDAHHQHLGTTDCPEIGAEDYAVAIQEYLDRDAVAYVMDSGLLSISETTGFDNEGYESLGDRKAIAVAAMDLGYRNGVSKQYDRYVIERMSRDVAADVDESQPASVDRDDPVVIHSLSCPIYIQSMLNGVSSGDRRPFSLLDEDGTVPLCDVPLDLIDQLSAISSGGLDLRTLGGQLTRQLQSRQDFEQAYQMSEPFPATVFRRIKNHE